jgi:inosose dehydratase
MELLDSYFGIVRHIHVKDCDLALLNEVSRSGGGLIEAWDRGVFCQLGLGTAGLEPFLEQLRERSWEGWLVVEQDRFLKPADTPEALLELHTNNRRWLTDLGF